MLQDLQDDAPEQARAPQLDWPAEMIHPPADRGEGEPASFVARQFSLDAVRGDEVLRIWRSDSTAPSSTTGASVTTC